MVFVMLMLSVKCIANNAFFVSTRTYFGVLIQIFIIYEEQLRPFLFFVFNFWLCLSVYLFVPLSVHSQHELSELAHQFLKFFT